MTTAGILAAALVLVAGAATAGQPEAGTTVILVRHAERTSMTDPDSPLSAEGRQRADALARLLRDASVSAIITSPRVRTQQTAEPLARDRRLTPRVLPADDLDGVVSTIRALAGQTVLVVHHSNTVPALADKLGVPIPPIADDEYDRLVIVTVPRSGPPSSVTLRFAGR